VQLVVVVVVLQQFFALLERTKFYLVLELVRKQREQFFEPLDLVLLEELVILEVDVLLVATALLQVGQGRSNVAVDLLDAGLQPGVGTR
jgi:hypothetical protein